MFFVIEFLLTITFYQFLKNDWIFINHGLFFRENILYISSVSDSNIKVLWLKSIEEFFLKIYIFEDFLLIFEMVNSRVADNVYNKHY